jgi:hypothetical protein
LDLWDSLYILWTDPSLPHEPYLYTLGHGCAWLPVYRMGIPAVFGGGVLGVRVRCWGRIPVAIPNPFAMVVWVYPWLPGVPGATSLTAFAPFNFIAHALLLCSHTRYVLIFTKLSASTNHLRLRTAAHAQEAQNEPFGCSFHASPVC